jgi:hypothetical protein
LEKVFQTPPFHLPHVCSFLSGRSTNSTCRRKPNSNCVWKLCSRSGEPPR